MEDHVCVCVCVCVCHLNERLPTKGGSVWGGRSGGGHELC